MSRDTVVCTASMPCSRNASTSSPCVAIARSWTRRRMAPCRSYFVICVLCTWPQNMQRSSIPRWRFSASTSAAPSPTRCCSTAKACVTAKVPTAPEQEESVLAAAVAVGAAGVERFSHGTTIATNALLERKGARTAFVATDGFEHLLHLRRQNRAHLYTLCAEHPRPLVALERLPRRARAHRAGRGARAARARHAAGHRRRRGGGLHAVLVPRSGPRGRDRERASSASAGRTHRRFARDRAGVSRVRAGIDDGRRRLPRSSLRTLFPRSRIPLVGCRTAAAARHAVVGGCHRCGRGGRASCPGPRVGPGGRSRRRVARGQTGGHRQGDRIRHGRDVHRRVPDHGRGCRADVRAERRRASRSGCR